MKYTVRQATALDIDQIISLCIKLAEFEGKLIRKVPSRSEITARVLDEVLHDSSCAYFVAEDGPKIIGIVKVAHKESGAAKISEAYVLEEYRNKGIMHALFERAVGWAVSRGLKFIYLTVVVGNDYAFNFWKKMGFEFESYATEKLIKMSRTLNADYAA